MDPQEVASTLVQVQCQVSPPWTQLDTPIISSSTTVGCNNRLSLTLSTLCRYSSTMPKWEQGDHQEHLELLLDSFLLAKELLLSFSLLTNNILDMELLLHNQGSRNRLLPNKKKIRLKN